MRNLSTISTTSSSPSFLKAARHWIRPLHRDSSATTTTTLTTSTLDSETCPPQPPTTHTLTPLEEKSLLWKIDKRMMFLLGFMMLIKSSDTENVANARILNLRTPSNIMTQLHMTSNEYNYVAIAFYATYILGEVPSTLLFKRMKPSRFQSRIMISWGIALTCHTAATNKRGLYVARAFLGLFESGLFPGALTQMCYWYRPDEMCRRLMLCFSVSCFSGVVSGLLAFACDHLNGAAGLAGWQWLFLIEGVFTIVFGCVVWFILPDFPPDAYWLTEREKAFVHARLPPAAPQADEKNFNWSEVVDNLKDVRLWLFTANFFFFHTGSSGARFYQPTVIANLGFTNVALAQLLNLPISILALIILLIMGTLGDSARVPRPLYPLAYALVVLICYGILYAYPSNGGVYTALLIGNACGAGWHIVMWPWKMETTSRATGSAFSIAFANSVGAIGAPLGPQIFRSQFAPKYHVPFAIAMGCVAASVVTLGLTWWKTRREEGETRRLKRERVDAAKDGRVLVEK